MNTFKVSTALGTGKTKFTAAMVAELMFREAAKARTAKDREVGQVMSRVWASLYANRTVVVPDFKSSRSKTSSRASNTENSCDGSSGGTANSNGNESSGDDGGGGDDDDESDADSLVVIFLSFPNQLVFEPSKLSTQFSKTSETFLQELAKQLAGFPFALVKIILVGIIAMLSC